MTELLARGAQILVALSGAYLIALWFVLIVWTYRDIEARSRNVVTQVLSTMLSVLFFVPGVLLYLILRPKDTLDQAFQRSLEEEYLLQDLDELPLCPSCQHAVEDDYRLCPHCHAQLREPCVACHRLVDLRWRICPYCAAPQRAAVGAPPADGVESLPGRWIAPGVTRRRRVVAIPPPGRAAVAEVPPGEVAMAAADAVPASAPLQLKAGLRSFTRPFDRWRNAGSLADEPSAAPLALEQQTGLAANDDRGPSLAPSPTAPPYARGRFHPVAMVPRISPEMPPADREVDGHDNGSTNGRKIEATSAPPPVAERELPKSDGPTPDDTEEEQRARELVKTSSE